MVAFVETGDFRSEPFFSARADADYDERGQFTVQFTDAPLSYKRGKTLKQKSQKKSLRLTPIHEEMDRETPFLSGNYDEDTGTPNSVCTSPSALSEEESFLSSASSETPALRRQKHITKMLNDVADAYEKELENIQEDNVPLTADSRVKRILRDLPPRPKCRMNVLPPSVTGPSNIGDVRKTKLLKRRNKMILDRVSSVSPLKDGRLDSDTKTVLLKDLKEHRPRSAGSGARVIRLSDLSSANSSSQPDLPSIISKLALGCNDDVRGVSDFDDSGALSTPRRPPETSAGPMNLDSSFMRGHEISSFYNMWEMDSKKRPFDKKECREPGPSLNRSCMCAVKQFGLKKCGHIQKRHFLPPLS